MCMYRGVIPVFSIPLVQAKGGEGPASPLNNVSQHLLDGYLDKDETIVVVCGYFPELPLLSNSVRIAKAGVLGGH